MRGRRVAGAPLGPVGIRRLDIDERDAIPGAAHRKVRIKPNIAFGELLETVLGLMEEIFATRRPSDAYARSYCDRRRRRRVRDDGLVSDMIDRELDRVRNSAGLDDGPTNR